MRLRNWLRSSDQCILVSVTAMQNLRVPQRLKSKSQDFCDRLPLRDKLEEKSIASGALVRDQFDDWRRERGYRLSSLSRKLRRGAVGVIPSTLRRIAIPKLGRSGVPPSIRSITAGIGAPSSILVPIHRACSAFKWPSCTPRQLITATPGGSCWLPALRSSSTGSPTRQSLTSACREPPSALRKLSPTMFRVRSLFATRVMAATLRPTLQSSCS